MKNKKIKTLFATVSFCTIAITAAYVAPAKSCVNTQTIKYNTNNTNDGIVPINMFNISNNVLYSFASDVNDASLSGYTSIAIPSNIQRLDDDCLHTKINPTDSSRSQIKCSTINSLTCEPDSQLTEVGKNIFSQNSSDAGLTGLSTIDLSNASNLYSLDEYSFAVWEDSDKQILKKVVLPSSIKSIPESCFVSNSALSDVNISELINLEEIGSNAFRECNLNSIIFPENLEFVNSSAFEDCANSISKIDFSKCNNLKRIESKTFENSLAPNCSIILNSTIEYIGNAAFYGGWLNEYLSLNSISIPKNVSFIGSNNFYIPSTPIPASGTIVTSIESPSSNLWCFHVNGTGASTTSYINFDINAINSNIYGIAAQAFESFWGDDKYISGKITLPSNVHYINDSAFQGQYKVTEYDNIPKCLKYISDNGFCVNSKISNFQLPEESELEYMGASAFKGCSELTSFPFENAKDLSYIGDHCFDSDIALVSANLAENTKLKKINKFSFSSCTALNCVTFPYSLINVSENAFASDTNIENVYFSYASSQFTDPYFNIFGAENFPKLKAGAHVYIPNGMTKEDYLKAIPDLPDDYKLKTTIWENWDAPAPTIDDNTDTTTNSFDKLLIIVLGCVAGVMLIIIISLAASLSKKKKLLKADPRNRKGNDPRRRPPMPPRRPRY